MNARTRHAPLLTLAFGAFAVAAAAVWGPYAQLLRVADDAGGSGLRLVVAELDAARKTTKTTAPALKPAVNSEGETPAAPRASRPVLDTPDRTAPDVAAWALAPVFIPVCPADTGPPLNAGHSDLHINATSPALGKPARGPPAA